MDKTLTIDGKSVTFRKTGGTIVRYQTEFGRELLHDLSRIYDLIGATDGTESEQVEAVGKCEILWMYDIAYTMAKQADDSIGSMLDWLDSFNSFPIFDVFIRLMPMLQEEMKIAPKNV